MSHGLSGIPKSPEHRAKISAALKGVPWDEIRRAEFEKRKNEEPKLSQSESMRLTWLKRRAVTLFLGARERSLRLRRDAQCVLDLCRFVLPQLSEEDRDRLVTYVLSVGWRRIGVMTKAVSPVPNAR